MKDILIEFYKKQYGRNKSNKIVNISLASSGTRELTFNSNNKHQNTNNIKAMKISKPIKQHLNVLPFKNKIQISNTKLPSLYSYLDNTKFQNKKRDTNGKNTHKEIMFFSKSDRILINKKKQSLIEELLRENTNYKTAKELQSNNNIILGKTNRIVYKNNEIDSLVFIKEQLKVNQEKYNLFRSNSIQISRL